MQWVVKKNMLNNMKNIIILLIVLMFSSCTTGVVTYVSKGSYAEGTVKVKTKKGERYCTNPFVKDHKVVSGDVVLIYKTTIKKIKP